MSRDPAALHVKLANLEHQTLLAAAVIACEARMAVTRERAYAAIFEATSEVVVQSGDIRDRRQSAAARLSSDGSREMVADAIDGLYMTYLDGVQKRARDR